MSGGDAASGWVGRAVPRSEDLRFVTGRGRYVDDLKFPGMLHAVVVRSAHAHAVLRGIDTAAARAVPGVFAVFTFADIAAHAAPIPIRTGPLEGTERYLQRPLASDRVRYVGEPVALVVAADRYVAEDAAERVAVDYEPLPAVVGYDHALSTRTLARCTRRTAPTSSPRWPRHRRPRRSMPCSRRRPRRAGACVPPAPLPPRADGGPRGSSSTVAATGEMTIYAADAGAHERARLFCLAIVGAAGSPASTS